MRTVKVEIPEEVAELMKRSKLGDRAPVDQVRIALAIQLLQEGIISVGKAARLAGEPRATFELILGEMGIPVVQYTLEDYRQDSKTIERLRQKRG